MSDVDVRLAEIRERCEAATPGPWSFSNSSDVTGRKGEFRAPSPYNGFMLVTAICNDADLSLIAAARSDVPFLLAELAVARGQLERVEALAEQWDAASRRVGTDGPGWIHDRAWRLRAALSPSREQATP